LLTTEGTESHGKRRMTGKTTSKVSGRSRLLQDL
jgi:hypothetical protein